MDVKDKIIWITGASSGIGKALAVEFSRYNTTLVLLSRNVEELEKTAEICRKNNSEAYVVQLDLADEESIKKAVKEAFDKVEKIDILVNNGGISQRSYSYETDFSVDKKIMQVNYLGAVLLTKLVLPKMIEQKSGHVVAISSVAGKFGFTLRSAYSASKFAMQGFFEALYLELKQFNIKVTVAFPGRIKTNVSQNALTKDGTKYGKLDEGQQKGISAEKCAKKIIKAVKKNKKEVFIAKSEIILVRIHQYVPFLFNLIANKIKPT